MREVKVGYRNAARFRCCQPWVISSLLLLIGTATLAQAEQKLTLPLLDSALWQTHSFNGVTEYNILTSEGQASLEAQSEGSASGIAFERRIDLFETPLLSWSWMAKTLPEVSDEQTRSGDDYAARVYIVIKDGIWFWRTRSLSYVWSSHQISGTTWDNAYAPEQVKMWAVRGRSDPLNQWFTEQRNVYQDLIDAFGDQGSAEANEEAYRYIDAVAIMTDSDDSQTRSKAQYADLGFLYEP